MHDKVGRAHVPVAPKCNIYCNFCTRNINDEENRPGVTSCIMKPDDAISHIDDVTAEGPWCGVGVAGPGCSLADEGTFEFFEKLGKTHPDLIKCMILMVFYFLNMQIDWLNLSKFCYCNN